MSGMAWHRSDMYICTSSGVAGAQPSATSPLSLGRHRDGPFPQGRRERIQRERRKKRLLKPPRTPSAVLPRIPGGASCPAPAATPICSYRGRTSKVHLDLLRGVLCVVPFFCAVRVDGGQFLLLLLMLHIKIGVRHCCKAGRFCACACACALCPVSCVLPVSWLRACLY
jgi:hypothetical protein